MSLMTTRQAAKAGKKSVHRSFGARPRKRFLGGGCMPSLRRATCSSCLQKRGGRCLIARNLAMLNVLPPGGLFAGKASPPTATST